MKYLAWLLILLAAPPVLTSSETSARGMRISDGRLVEADGTPLVMRGAAHGHAWYRDRTPTAVGDLAMLGANTVRIVLTGGRWAPATDVHEIRAITHQCRLNRVVCVLENHDTTGFGEQQDSWSLERATDFWLGVREALLGQEDYLIINIGNEPFGNTEAQRWTGATTVAVQRLRQAGLRHVLMVDAPNWGQDWQFVMRDNASAVLRADPQRNVLFSVHMYGVFKDKAGISAYLDSFAQQGLAITIGEFGRHHPAGEPDIDALLAEADKRAIGYLAWLWSGGEAIDLTTAFHPYRLTAWGRRLFADIHTTSRAASIYGGRPVGLRDTATIGFAADATALATDPVYRFVAAREFNQLTPENAFKWDATEPSNSDYRFDDADRIVAFARSHKISVHGHALVWHQQNPRWLESLAAPALREALRDHITVVVGRYADEPWVKSWDVVNEAVDDNGRLRDSLWLRTLGSGYLAEAFRMAKAADSDAVLCLNDYGAEGIGVKSDALFALVKQLRAQQVPVECVGFQGHLSVGKPFPADMKRNLQRFADLGVQVRISELDVRVPLPASAESLAAQARYYSDLVQACRAVAGCTGITLWGLTDRHSWVPANFPGEGAALPFDDRFHPKPAYAALRR